MAPSELLETSALLGAFVLLAGGYGVLYALGRLQERGDFVAAGFAVYAMQCGVALAVLLFMPLGGWKVLVALSCVAYAAVPPITWRYLTRLHERHEP